MNGGVGIDAVLINSPFLATLVEALAEASLRRIMTWRKERGRVIALSYAPCGSKGFSVNSEWTDIALVVEGVYQGGRRRRWPSQEHACSSSSRQDRHGTRVAAAKDVTDRIEQVMPGQTMTISALLGPGEASSNSCNRSQ